MSSNKDVVTPSSAERLVGRVKWFNNKAGYGFITVTDGERSGSDVFIHHSAIEVENQQYKYLVQGEYVDFGITKTSSGDHEWEAVDVYGIKGGKLMCETRHEFKVARNNYRGAAPNGSPDETECTEPLKMPRQQRVRNEVAASLESPQTSQQTQGPAQDLDGKSWSMVQKKQPGRGRGRPPRSVHL
jgi:cold shock CspA family protein